MERFPRFLDYLTSASVPDYSGDRTRKEGELAIDNHIDALSCSCDGWQHAFRSVPVMKEFHNNERMFGHHLARAVPHPPGSPGYSGRNTSRSQRERSNAYYQKGEESYAEEGNAGRLSEIGMRPEIPG